MKTLPEIVKLYSIDVAYAARRQKVGNLHQEQQLFIDAIAKELMGCLPEKKQECQKDWCDSQSCHEDVGYNYGLDEVRARLTAFIGHKEK